MISIKIFTQEKILWFFINFYFFLNQFFKGQYGGQPGEMILGSIYLTLEKGSLLVTVLAELQYNK